MTDKRMIKFQCDGPTIDLDCIEAISEMCGESYNIIMKSGTVIHRAHFSAGWPGPRERHDLEMLVADYVTDGLYSVEWWHGKVEKELIE